MRHLTVLTLLVAAACASPSEAGVVRSGFTVRDGVVGTGAVVRSDRPVRDVELRVSFYRSGKKVGTERDRLPFCPRSTDCIWAQQTFAERLGEVDRVEIVVTRTKSAPSTPQLRILRTRKTAREIVVMPNGVEGTVYLVAFDAGIAKLGRSFFVRRDERSPLHFSAALFPRRRGDRIVAYLYPGPVPARVGGPAD